jgi:hypothetical protein
MKIRMLVHMSGTRNGQEWPPAGVSMDLPDGEAGDYIAAGIAEPADNGAETAVAQAAESAEVPAAEVAKTPAPEKRAASKRAPAKAARTTKPKTIG